MKGLRRLVLLSLLAAVATVLGYVESLLPPLLALALSREPSKEEAQ